MGHKVMHMEWTHFENLLWKLMKMKMVFIVDSNHHVFWDGLRGWR